MYIINLKDPEQITMENVRRMIASVDDSEHSQVRVSQDGLAYVANGVVGDGHIEGVLFRSEETFFAGNGYVGPHAAADLEWIWQIYEALKKLQKAFEDLKTNWPKPTYTLAYGAEEPYALWPPMVDGYEGPYANWTELANGYGGQKVAVEYLPDENGYFDLFNRKVHLF
jgi:hypothetical protein